MRASRRRRTAVSASWRLDADHLERHVALELAVARPVHHAHAAARDLAQELVARAGEVGPLRDLAQAVEGAVARRLHDGSAPEESARLRAELLLARRDLAQRLEHRPAQLAARPVQVVRHLRHRQRRTPPPGPRSAAARPCLDVLEVVALEEPERRLAARAQAALPQRLDREREQARAPTRAGTPPRGRCRRSSWQLARLAVRVLRLERDERRSRRRASGAGRRAAVLAT